MSTVGIVALSLLVGAFIIALLGISAWLVWLIIAFRRDVTALHSSLSTFTDDATNTLTLHRTEIRKAFESQGALWERSITSLADTLTARHREWSMVTDKFGDTLAAHRTLTDEQIRKINGQELSEAVAKFAALTQQEAAAATRIERAAIAIGTFTREWLSDRAIGDTLEPVTEGIDPATGYAATRPGEPSYVSRSRTAADDIAALAEESEDVTQTNE
jgi:hypothetical protein